MATGMQINSIAIDQPMDESGTYHFARPVIGTNGRGAAILAPYATLTWRWDYLTPTQMNWWINGILLAAASQEYTQAKFFNEVGVLTTYAHCIVYKPTYARFQDGLLWEVEVIIDWIY
jgi:hypothetical protein